MDYELIRSRRRTMSIEITREERVVVRVPRRCTRAEAERFVAAHTGWIEEHLTQVKARRARHPEPTEAEERLLRRRAEELLPEKTAHYAALMGVRPTGVRITSARTRFGSCSAKNSICYSWRLMQYPEEAIDYVVVHELAHIIEKNHSRAFYAVIERYLPDWRQRRALLRE